MSIKTIWHRLFGKSEKDLPAEEPKIAIVRIPTEVNKPEIPSFSDMNERQLKLSECFYGTLVPREDRPHKKRHLQDGWRHGISNPYHYAGKVYDVGYNIDESYETFKKLIEEFREGG